MYSRKHLLCNRKILKFGKGGWGIKKRMERIELANSPWKKWSVTNADWSEKDRTTTRVLHREITTLWRRSNIRNYAISNGNGSLDLKLALRSVQLDFGRTEGTSSTGTPALCENSWNEQNCPTILYCKCHIRCAMYAHSSQIHNLSPCHICHMT